MDKTLQLQLQIRQNADEISTALKDMKGWEKNIIKKDKNLKIEKKKIAPRRIGGGTVPLRTFAPTTQASNSNILTPASLVDTTLSKAKVDEKQGTSLAHVPKAIGIYEEKDAEEIERERGNNEFKGGNFSAAVKSYTKCLGLKKNNYVAFSNRAMAYLKLKEYHRAVLDCNCALSIEALHVKSLLRRATAYNAMGKHRAALRDLLSAQSIEPNNKQVKLDLLQTKELLRSAVNRAPFVSVNSFQTFVEEFIHQDPSRKEDLSEPNEKVEAEVIQGPDLPPSGIIPQILAPSEKDGSVHEKIDESEGFKRISIEEDEAEVKDSADKIPETETKETVEEDNVESFNNMRIHLISEEEEAEEEQNPPQAASKPNTKTSPTPKPSSSSTLKKKKSTTSSSSSASSFIMPKSSYELEKVLLQYHRRSPTKLRDFFSQVKREKCVQLFKNCFEPSTLSLFLDALFADYSFQKENSSSSSSSNRKARQATAAYYRDVSELSNFNMLYGLLTSEEKQRIVQQIERTSEDVRVSGDADEIDLWQNLSHRYQI